MPADSSTGSAWLVILLVIGAAVLVDARRRRRAHTPTRPRRRYAVLVVLAIVCSSALIGSPAMAAPLDCKEAPEPDRPRTGLVGSLDTTPFGVGEPGSVYDEVGYAGLIWHNYDLGCIGSVAFNPATTTDTWLGNQALNVAKLVVGGVNWAHYLISGNDTLLAPLDNLVVSGTTAMYDGFFSTWVGPVLAILAAILLVLALRGDLPSQARRTLYALLALAVGSAAYLSPVGLSKISDTLLLNGVTKMQEGFLDQVGLGDRDTLPTILVDQIAYQNWLRGEFGAVDVPQAQELGRPLLRAQAFTKVEVNEGRTGADVAQQKKTEFAAIADRMADRYPYFQGKAGSRIGAGTLALIQAISIALLQLLSKILLLVALLIIRLMVITAPAIAVIAILKPDILPALLRIGGAAIVNTLIVGALAGLHALMVVSLFRPGSNIDLWLALLVTGVVTVVLWAVARPFRRLVSMVSLTRDQFSGIVPAAGAGPMSRVWQRVRGSSVEDRQTRWWDERRATAEGAGGFGGARPETASTERVRATATRVQPGSAQVEVPVAPQIVPAARRPALPAGGGSGARRAGASPSWDDPGDIDDRTIYRRPDAVPMRPGEVRPVNAELVDGVPVYRIYRPRTSQAGYQPRGVG